MANRFLPIYLFLLLLGTAAPLWAQGSPEPRCIHADEDEEIRKARYGGGPWSIQGNENLCHLHSELNSEFPLPPLPGGVQLDPDMKRLIQFEIAKKTFRDCMIELVYEDPAKLGVNLFSDININAICECNRRIYGVEFECSGFYPMLSERIPKRVFHKFMERKNDSKTQCIAVLGFNFFHKGRDGQLLVGGHAVTLVNARETENGDVHVDIREPNYPAKTQPLILKQNPQDPDYVVKTFNPPLKLAHHEEPTMDYISTVFLKCPVSEEETTEETGLED